MPLAPAPALPRPQFLDPSLVWAGSAYSVPEEKEKKSLSCHRVNTSVSVVDAALGVDAELGRVRV